MRSCEDQWAHQRSLRINWGPHRDWWVGVMELVSGWKFRRQQLRAPKGLNEDPTVGLPTGHRELVWDLIEVSGHKEELLFIANSEQRSLDETIRWNGEGSVIFRFVQHLVYYFPLFLCNRCFPQHPHNDYNDYNDKSLPLFFSPSPSSSVCHSVWFKNARFRILSVLPLR